MVRKVYLDFLHVYGYRKQDIYSLAFELGERLVNFIGEDVFKLLLDSKVLKITRIKGISTFADPTFRLHPAAQALEAFLEKVINGQGLRESEHDRIGDVFGKKDSIVRRRKIKDKKLIGKTKSVWDFCRNDVMHYSEKHSIASLDLHKRYDEIIELMVLLYRDFYGKSEPAEEVRRKMRRYSKLGSVRSQAVLKKKKPKH